MQSGAGRRHSRNFIWLYTPLKKKLSERSGALVWNDIAAFLACSLARTGNIWYRPRISIDSRARPAVLSNLFPDTHSAVRDREIHLISHSRALLSGRCEKMRQPSCLFQSINLYHLMSQQQNKTGNAPNGSLFIFFSRRHLIYYSDYSCP
jgi:hypothetical protein